MQFDIRYPIIFLSLIMLIGGLYFKFLYDVPDGQEGTNNHVSFILVVIGIIGIIVGSIWKKKNPMQFDSDEHTKNDSYNSSTNTNTSNKSIRHSKRNLWCR